MTTKHDETKRRWDLMPWVALQSIVDVLQFGAMKYGDNNWRTVEHGKRRYFAAAMRHLVAWALGEETDRESGLPHLAHAACCLLFMMEL